MAEDWCIGVIGGSGLYRLDGLEDAQWITVASPWGEPSDDILCGRIGGVRLRFLPRHGRGHRIPPGRINARANIDALKRAGCTDIVSVCAVGALDPLLAPGSAVVVDQFIDQTRGRPNSFFDTGLVAHVSLAEPTCPRLSRLLTRAATGAAAGSGGTVRENGTYLAIEGPQFSTRAESRLYQSWGAHVVGMTAMPEARLAREAELPYAVLALATDRDAWSADVPSASVDEMMAFLGAGTALARDALVRLVAALPERRPPSPIDRALDDAVLTSPDSHDRALLVKLDAVAGRLLRGADGAG